MTASVCRELILTPQPPEVDMDLFIRPFTDDSWVSLAFMAGVLLFSAALPYIIVPASFEGTDSHRQVCCSTKS